MSQFPHILEEINDLSLDQVKAILRKAKRIKEGYLTPGTDSFSHSHQSYQDTTVITYFSENSTRTKISFMQSIYNLGVRHINFDVHLSSVQKGESLRETFLTLKALGADMVIYRTNKSRELHDLKEHPPFKIINAGDGVNQHPTQALLDLFTMVECGHDPEGKTISIIGDCLHSRVCHSLVELLSMWGAKVLLVGPSNMLPNETNHENVELETDLDKAIERSDFLYPLRIQFERHGKDEYEEDLFSKNYHEQYGINLERLKKLNKNIPVYHAGPANIGVEISQDIVDSELYMAYEQVEHSIPMRTAIIRCLLSDKDGPNAEKI